MRVEICKKGLYKERKKCYNGMEWENSFPNP